MANMYKENRNQIQGRWLRCTTNMEKMYDKHGKHVQERWKIYKKNDE